MFDVGEEIRERGVAGIVGGEENQVFFFSSAFLFRDDRMGFTLGTNLVREALVIPIPRALAPGLKAMLEEILDVRLFGNGSPVGSFDTIRNSYQGFVASLYTMGGWIFVVPGMWLAGWTVRKVQRLTERAPYSARYAVYAVTLISSFPLIFRFNVEGLPYFLGMQLVPATFLVAMSRRISSVYYLPGTVARVSGSE